MSVRAAMTPRPTAPAHVLVVGPRLDARGGIARVNATYASAGLFDAGDGEVAVRYFPSTRDGPAILKLGYAAARLGLFGITPLRRPAVIHLHTTWHASFWRKAAYAWVARLKRARVIHHIHAFGFLEFYDRGGGLRRRIVRGTLRRASALIALTDAMAERLRAIAPGQTVVVLPNPVDLRALRMDDAPPRDPHLIAYLGWFVAEKGIFELLEALAIARRSVPSLRLTLGGCRNEEAVLAHVRRLGLDDGVHMAGWLDRAGVVRTLHQCAVLALPSHNEGFGLVLVEAMACGTPIVTCPVGGVPEVVQAPRNAVFVPPRDVPALAQAIVRLVGSPELRRAMAAAGPEDASRFEAGRVVERLREIYRAVLRQGAAPS